ncbi:MAG TPA: glycoside hydrolase family 76 protein [Verrucomicrobiae bacterium]|nr:glycoside hydrolase family 76 protein [Verrucomicrobiae bacterium]
MKSKLELSGLRAALLLLIGATHLLFASPAHAFTATDAKTLFKAYNDAFYFEAGTNGYYKESTEGGKTYFWERAEQLEMILDVYERSRDPKCLTLFSNIFNGFLSDHTSNWRKNDFNDDIMWMVIACSRAYQHTGNPVFRDVAKQNFDMCFERGWSADLGGGLFWKVDNLSKNACVNGPGAIAAHLLYQIHGDTNYLAKSEAMFQWLRATLFNTNTGAVHDNINLRGNRDLRTYTYNQGTFVGAANLLGRTNDALLAADYTMNVISRGGLMPRYGESGDGGGFNGICARWISRFMVQRGLENRYGGWLQYNAETAWDVRRAADNLSWPRWRQRTPQTTLHSWACSSSVVTMHAVPPTEGPGGIKYPGVVPRDRASRTDAATSGLPSEFSWTGNAKAADGSLIAVIKVNTEDTPDLTGWGRRAGELCAEWYPRISALLASDGFTPPDDVRLTFRNDYDGVASTRGSRIDISAHYVRGATNDFGMVIRELVHVVQGYPRNRNASWVAQGLAEYVRMVHFEPQASRPRFDLDTTGYRDNPKAAACFLEWIEKHHDSKIISELNRALRAGTFRPALLEQRTGKPLEALWNEFKTILHSTKA